MKEEAENREQVKEMGQLEGVGKLMEVVEWEKEV